MALNEENHPFEYGRPSFNILSNSEFNTSNPLTHFDFGSGANIALSMPPTAPKSPSKDSQATQDSSSAMEKPQKSEASNDLGTVQPPQPHHDSAPQPSFISHGQDGTTFSFPPAATSGQNLSPLGGSPSAVPHSAPHPDGTTYGLPSHTMDAHFSDNHILHNFPGLDAHAASSQHPLGVNMASISNPMAQDNNNNTMPNGAHQNQPATSSTLVPVPQHSGPNYTDITEYLNMPQNEAAKRLQIPTSTLSKRWKEAVVNRKWPYRTVCKIDKEVMFEQQSSELT